MATFDAGSIEGSLDLDLSPFNLALDEALRRANDFDGKTFKANADLDTAKFTTELDKIKAKLAEFKRDAASATARVDVDRNEFDRLLITLRAFARTTYTARARVDVDGLAELAALRAELAALPRRTDVDVNVNSSQGMASLGSMNTLIMGIIFLLPVIASGLAAALGLAGALGSALVILGVGFGALAIVAIPALKQITDALGENGKGIQSLPPYLRAAAKEYQNLQNEMKALQQASGPAVANMLGQAFRTVTDILRTLQPVIIATANAFTGALVMVDRFFNSPTWKSFTTFLVQVMSPVTLLLTGVLLDLVGTVTNLTQAFYKMGGDQILQMIADGFHQMFIWSQSLGDNPGFKIFMDTVVAAVPPVMRFIGELIVFLLHLMEALAPLGNIILDLATTFLHFINSISPGALGVITVAIIALGLAVTGIAGPWTIAAVAIMGVAAGLAYLFTTVGPAHTALQRFIDGLRSWFEPFWNRMVGLWNAYVIPAWDNLVKKFSDPAVGSALGELAKLFTDYILPALTNFATVIVRDAIPALINFVIAIAPFVGFFATLVGKALISAVSIALTVLTGALKIASDILNVITDILNGDWSKAWEDTKAILTDLADTILRVFGTSYQEFDTWAKNTRDIVIKWANDTRDSVKEWGTNFNDTINHALGLGEMDAKTWHDSFLGHITDTWTDTRATTGAWGQGFNDDINGWLGKVGDGIAEWGKKINDSFHRDFWDPIENWFHDRYTGYMGSDAHKWITTLESDFETTVANMAKKVSDSFQHDFVEKISGILEPWIIKVTTSFRNDFWNPIDTGFNQWQTKVSTSFQHDFLDVVGQAVTAWITKVKNSFQNDFLNPVGTLFSTFATKTSTSFQHDFLDVVSTAVSGWVTKVKNSFQNDLINPAIAFFSGFFSKVTASWKTDFVDVLVRVTNDAVHGLDIAWRAVANIFRNPINWVIRVVMNDGILKGWNTVMNWIGQGPLNVGPIPEIPAFAEGGQVRGAGTGTSDSILARISDGEYIMPSDITSKHLHFLEALRSGQAEAVQAAGGRHNPMAYPGFAAGGVANAQTVAQSMNGKPYIWGGAGPGGADCSGYQSIITNALRGMANPYSRIGTTANFPWAGFQAGMSSAYSVGAFKGNPGHMAGTLGGVNVESGGSHGNVAYGGPAVGADSGQFNIKAFLPEAGGVFAPGGGGTSQTVSWWSLLADKVKALFNNLLNFSGMPITNSAVGKAIQRIPAGLVSSTISALEKKLSDLFTTIFSTTVSGTASPVGMAVQAAVDGAAKPFGWGLGSANWTPLSLLIGRESGWNPNAQNPTSTAYGLFQFLDSTWATVGGTKTSNPGLQATYGMKYIQQRYGTPASAWAHETSAGWYDAGGVLNPGINLAINHTGKPERVLNADHTAKLDNMLGGVGNSDVSDKLDVIARLLKENGAGATFNVMGGGSDPVETARRTALAIKMR